MGLDIYVMPIWKFKVGEFTTPAERALGGKVKTITLNGVLERARNLNWIARWRARQEVSAIRKAVESANGTRIDWSDEGNVVYSEQSGGMEALKAYARWLDLRDQFPDFVEPPERNYYKHPVMAIDYRHRWTCPHLINHDCYSGYYLPCDFKRLISIEPHRVWSWTFDRTVGSSIRLQSELIEIGRALQIADDWNYDGDDPLFYVKSAYVQLRQVCRLSCQHKLPIIFWG